VVCLFFFKKELPVFVPSFSQNLKFLLQKCSGGLPLFVLKSCLVKKFRNSSTKDKESKIMKKFFVSFLGKFFSAAQMHTDDLTTLPLVSAEQITAVSYLRCKFCGLFSQETI
jgi:hypothetical protein